MTYRFLIFLALCSAIFADRTCLVGGSLSNEYYAGWLDPDQTSIAASDAGSGDAIIKMTSVVYDHTGGEDEKMLSKAGIGAGVEVGMYAFVSGDNITPGRYLIDTVAGDDSYVACSGIVATDDNVDSIVNVGGAVPNTYNVDAYDLEDVLDDSIGDASGQQVKILIHTQSDVDPTESIRVDSNGGGGAFWKRLIGCDSSYAALPVGSYAVYDCGAVGLGAGVPVFFCDRNNIRFENIAALNPDGSGGTPAAGEDSFSNSGDNVRFINCKAQRAYRGFNLAAGGDRASLIDCYAVDSVFRNVSQQSVGCSIKGGRYDWGTAFAADKNIAALYHTTMDNVTIVGGTYGLTVAVGPGLITVSNCNFIGQTTAGYHNNNAAVTGIVSNCIFDVTDTAADYAIYAQVGQVVEFNNISDADTSALSGFQANSGSTENLTFTNTDPFVNASGGNVQINWSGSVAKGYVLGKGYAPYLGASTPVGLVNIGAGSVRRSRNEAYEGTNNEAYGNTNTYYRE